MGAGRPRRLEGGPADFAAVVRHLREILQPYRSRLVATSDGPGGLVLEIPGMEGKPWGYVAGIRQNKRYVSFYLMSVYGRPELLPSISPELRRRMQGKACFNFSTVDEPLFAELARLVDAGLDGYLAMAAQAGKRGLRREHADRSGETSQASAAGSG